MTGPQKIEHKRHFGCLGCLWHVGVILVLATIAYLATIGVFAPWAFYLGGKFHITPYWQGWGRLHAKSGDYLLFVRIQPTSKGSKMYLETNLSGTAHLCTARGENIPLKLGGGMPKHLKLSTDGEAIHLGMGYWPWNAQFVADHSPTLQLRGHWQNPNLVMDDQGSIAKAFQPDGTVYRSHDRNRAYSPEVVPVTFVEGGYGTFSAACTAMHR
jgi:hypothetical protein